MNSTAPAIDRGKLFRVRPGFLLGCVVFLLVLALPGAIQDRLTVQKLFLAAASLAVAAGWFFLWKYREPNTIWRVAIALVASLYLTVSLPAFAVELGPVKWLTIHPAHHALSMYVHPWVDWGYFLVLSGVVGSFFGRGRARIAFVVGSFLQLVLWESLWLLWVY